MSGPAPAVDEGDPLLTVAALWRELAPTPGRFGNTMRLVVVVSVLVTLCELFRIPEPALAGFIAVFISKEDAASTTRGALVIGLFAMLGIGLAILCFMLTLSNPALRIVSVAGLTFTTMFLSRASNLGAGFFLSGFLALFGLTYGDELQVIGLQPSSAADTPDFSLPELAFMPPEEALLHTLLWLALVAAMTVSVVVVGNLLTGQDPGLLLRRGLAAQLDALAAACSGQEGAEARLEALALEGTSTLSKQAALAVKFRRRPTVQRRTAVALVEPVGRLVVGVLAWLRIQPGPGGGGAVPGLETLAPALQRWRQAVLADGNDVGELPAPVEPPATTASGDAILTPLGADLDETLRRVAAAYRREGGDAEAKADRKKPFALMRPDAFTNPDYPRFGFKVTLAAMICYLGYAVADWSQIHTALVTCCFVPQETLGQTVHKAVLRIGGCLVGASLGIATILLFMPAMTDIGQLLVAIGLITFAGAWISNGSARTSYAGLQLAFAFYLVVLQGFGPTLDMQTGRDRVIGILFGITVTSTIFAVVWPVRVGDLVRNRLAGALEQLADQVSRLGRPPALQPFAEAVAGARDLMVHEAFIRRAQDGPRRTIDARLLSRLQALVVPVAIVLRLTDPAEAGSLEALPQGAREDIEAYHRDLSRWLRDAAGWVRERAPATRFADTLPAAPALPTDGATASPAAWYSRLDGDLRAILGQLVAAGAERQAPARRTDPDGDAHAAA